MARLIYAIGDVHGRHDLLKASVSVIHSHLAGRLGRIIFLGDYVDRGPESREVVEFLIRAQREGAVECLRGNHEQIMVDACRYPDDGTAMDLWLANGGLATLASYGGRNAIPEEHLAWMEGLPFLSTDGHRAYVHAGVMPGFPLEQQADETCIWIRERFLRASAEELPCHVVHGHTPRWEGKPDYGKPELLPHRTNLDTAAFHTGVLTIGVFDADADGGPIEVLRVTVPKETEQSQHRV